LFRYGHIVTKLIKNAVHSDKNYVPNTAMHCTALKLYLIKTKREPKEQDGLEGVHLADRGILTKLE
jgi:hypothetical protein